MSDTIKIKGDLTSGKTIADYTADEKEYVLKDREPFYNKKEANLYIGDGDSQLADLIPVGEHYSATEPLYINADTGSYIKDLNLLYDSNDFELTASGSVNQLSVKLNESGAITSSAKGLDIKVSESSPLENNGNGLSIPAATSSNNGYMTKAQASKLNGISSGANKVSYEDDLPSGVKIGTLTIDSDSIPVHAPMTYVLQNNTNGNNDFTRWQYIRSGSFQDKTGGLATLDTARNLTISDPGFYAIRVDINVEDEGLIATGAGCIYINPAFSYAACKIGIPIMSKNNGQSGIKIYDLDLGFSCKYSANTSGSVNASTEFKLERVEVPVIQSVYNSSTSYNFRVHVRKIFIG